MKIQSMSGNEKEIPQAYNQASSNVQDSLKFKGGPRADFRESKRDTKGINIIKTVLSWKLIMNPMPILRIC